MLDSTVAHAHLEGECRPFLARMRAYDLRLMLKAKCQPIEFLVRMRLSCERILYDTIIDV